MPPTNPTSATPAASGDKQKWLAAYMAQPETLQMFKMWEGHKFVPTNEEDRKAMFEIAEWAYKPTKFTGAVAQAFRAMRDGNGDPVIVEEV